MVTLNGNTQSAGIQETKELLVAAGDIAVLVYRAQKGGGNASEIAQRIAAQLMTNPAAIANIKTAADGIGQVPVELKDLSLGEIFELLSVAGDVAQKCTAAIAA